MLDPQRAVLVEGGDPLGRRHEGRTALLLVVSVTNSTIACLAEVSFQDGRGSVWAWAVRLLQAKATGTKRPANAASSARRLSSK